MFISYSVTVTVSNSKWILCLKVSYREDIAQFTQSSDTHPTNTLLWNSNDILRTIDGLWSLDEQLPSDKLVSIGQ